MTILKKEFKIKMLARCMDDLPYMAKERLKIRTKSGDIIPFVFNREQIYLHEKAEGQRRLTGKVRIIVLKGRQQGISTYIAARFYTHTTHFVGIMAFILTHAQDATNNLFDMVSRFKDHDYLPPEIGKSNTKELMFPLIESGYRVGTAGSKAVGRSMTVQRMHWSEAAFSENAEEHFAGIMQAVPNEPNTEVFLESTGNGMGGTFHQKCKDAIKGISEFQLVFIPWFWHGGYKSPTPDDFEMDINEVEYQKIHSLTAEQMYWRRKKIEELGAGLFKQEYPATVNEAFQAGNFESYISSNLITEARKRNNEPGPGAIISCDPAESPKGDRFTIGLRAGTHIEPIDVYRGVEPMEGVGLIVAKYEAVRRLYKKVIIVIDGVGIGAGIFSRLKELNYPVFRVNGGGTSSDQTTFKDCRAEWAYKHKEYMENGGDMPDDEATHLDCVALGFGYTSSQQLQIESKRSSTAKKRGVKSTDIWDNICMSFAINLHMPIEKKKTTTDKYLEKTGRGQGRKRKNFMSA